MEGRARQEPRASFCDATDRACHHQRCEARDGAISDLSMFAKSIEKSAPIVAGPPAPAIAGPTTSAQLVAGPAGGSAAQTCATGWGGVSSFSFGGAFFSAAAVWGAAVAALGGGGGGASKGARRSGAEEAGWILSSRVLCSYEYPHFCHVTAAQSGVAVNSQGTRLLEIFRPIVYR
jgi:hypothetical protein